MNETLYLEVTEIGLPMNSTIGISVRLPVVSQEAAVVLRDEIVGRFFAGVQWKSELHIHKTDGGCELIPLP